MGVDNRIILRIKWDDAGNLLSTPLASQMLVINVMFIVTIQGQQQN